MSLRHILRAAITYWIFDWKQQNIDNESNENKCQENNVVARVSDKDFLKLHPNLAATQDLVGIEEPGTGSGEGPGTGRGEGPGPGRHRRARHW